MSTRRNAILVLAIAAAASAAAGCDGTDGGAADAGDQQDLENPAITMDNVALYAGVSGTFGVEVTATDDVGIGSVELLVDGEVAASSTAEPFTISWDTTAIPAGTIVPIAARAVDLAGKTAETDPVEVVVINGGYAVAFDEGSTGEISIPAAYDGTQEVDEKHHWIEVAGGASRILAITRFTIAEGQADWGVGLDIGSGWCPDSGETLDSMVLILDGAPVVFDSQIDGGYPGGGQLFFHLKPANPTDHLGEALGYEVWLFSFE